jgi:hypothetical protein
MRPEIDFPTTDPRDIIKLYSDYGCILLRNFCNPSALTEFANHISTIHHEVGEFHVYPKHLRDRGIQAPQNYLFGNKHYGLLAAIFGDFGYEDLEDVVSRHMDPHVESEGWQGPLGPHLDAFVHATSFTVNFWVPLQRCGLSAPGLGCVCSRFDAILDYTCFNDAGRWQDGEDPGGNYGKFRPAMLALSDDEPPALAEFQQRFADRYGHRHMSLATR